MYRTDLQFLVFEASHSLTRTSYQPDILPSHPHTSSSPFSASCSCFLSYHRCSLPFSAQLQWMPDPHFFMRWAQWAREQSQPLTLEKECDLWASSDRQTDHSWPRRSHRSSPLCHHTLGSAWSHTGCSRRKRQSLDSDLRADKNQVLDLTPSFLSAQRFLSPGRNSRAGKTTSLLSCHWVFLK